MYKQGDSNNSLMNKQLQALQPIRIPTQQILEEIRHLEDRITILKLKLIPLNDREIRSPK